MNWRRQGRAIVSAAILFGALLAVWTLCIRVFRIQPFLLPGPAQVAAAGWARRGSLVTSLGITAGAAAGGLAGSLAVGVLIAMVFAQWRGVRRLLYPYTILLQTVPIVAIAPLILMWIGPGLLSVMLVSFIICLAPIIANTTQGLISLERSYLDLFAMNNASRAQTMMKLRLPHALPALFTGVRISSGIAVIGAITGELFAGSARVGEGGIGYAIQYANAQMETDYLFALVAAATALGFTFFFAVMFAEWSFLHRWHESARRTEED